MDPSLEVVIWDVQHGSAAFIKTPTGRTLAVDLGTGSFKNPADVTFSPLCHLRYTWNYTALDALIITHPHKDHLEDIVNLHLVKPKVIVAPRRIDRRLVLQGNQGKDTSFIDTYFQWLDTYRGAVSVENSLDNERAWGCSIKWFFPVYAGSNLNNYSIVVVISYAGSTVVIPGDNEASSWKSLLEGAGFVSAISNTNVYVTAHHGRESGYHADLFKHFKPSLCVVSDTTDIPTSATDKYTYHAQGWNVYNRETGKYEPRKTVTTRSDDAIYIKCWPEWSAQEGCIKNFMEVRIN